MWIRVFIVFLSLSAADCAVRRRVNIVVPQRCIHLNAESFTRPCEQRRDVKLVCDRVVVSATCVQRAQ